MRCLCKGGLRIWVIGKSIMRWQTILEHSGQIGSFAGRVGDAFRCYAPLGRLLLLRPKNAVGQKTFAVSKIAESLLKNSVPTGEQAHRDAVFEPTVHSALLFYVR